MKKTVKQGAEMDRNKLLQDKTRENKDPQKVLVSRWHPKLNAVTSVLKSKFHSISNDPKLFKNFQTKPYPRLSKKQNAF